MADPSDFHAVLTSRRTRLAIYLIAAVCRPSFRASEYVLLCILERDRWLQKNKETRADSKTFSRYIGR